MMRSAKPSMFSGLCPRARQSAASARASNFMVARVMPTGDHGAVRDRTYLDRWCSRAERLFAEKTVILDSPRSIRCCDPALGFCWRRGCRCAPKMRPLPACRRSEHAAACVGDVE